MAGEVDADAADAVEVGGVEQRIAEQLVDPLGVEAVGVDGGFDVDEAVTQNEVAIGPAQHEYGRVGHDRAESLELR